jgi:hypothetical protein
MKSLADPAVKKSLVDRIARLQPGSRRQWGRMSAHQMICHLNDSFRGVMGERQVSSSTSLLYRTLVKWIALYGPAPWPKGVPTRPEVEQGVGGTPPEDFDRDREDLIALIDRFGHRGVEGYAHPMFGRLRRKEWLRWAYLHVDHHLRQFGG